MGSAGDEKLKNSMNAVFCFKLKVLKNVQLNIKIGRIR